MERDRAGPLTFSSPHHEDPVRRHAPDRRRGHSDGTVWLRSLVPPTPLRDRSRSLGRSGSCRSTTGPAPDRLVEGEGPARDRALLGPWCPPCVEELPALSGSGTATGDGTTSSCTPWSVDRDWKTIESFSANIPPAPLLPRPGASTASRFGSSHTGDVRHERESGRVLFRVQGAVSWDDPGVRQRIEQLLAS